ncbi:MAG: FAD-binding oxidoreductase [bacterium]|nr:FAD-binding oxidoreductase [bacterium]
MKIIKGKKTYIYSLDAAFRGVNPKCVFIAENLEDIANVLKLQNPIIPRGSGTNLTGSTIPLKDEFVLVIAIEGIKDINTAKKTATVYAGTTNLKLQEALSTYGFFYPPDPASQISSTIGGNFSTNAGGIRCLKYGSTKNNIRSIKGFFGSGDYFEFSSYDNYPDLIGFLSGSEGTLSIITEVEVDIEKIQSTTMAIFQFNDLKEAMEFVSLVISSGILPIAIEGIDENSLNIVKESIDFNLEGKSIILIEALEDELIRSIEISKKFKAKYITSNDKEKLWKIRKLAYPSLAKVKNNVLVEDGVVPRNKLPDIIDVIKIVEKEYGINIYSVFHAGDGNIHPQIPYNENDALYFKRIKNASKKIIEKCVDLNGSITGEHGVGVDKLDLMGLIYGESEYKTFQKLKEAFDPNRVLNPLKTINFTPKIKKSNTYKDFVEKLFEIKKNTEKVIIKGKGSVLKNITYEVVTIETSSLNKIIDFDKENYTITVQSGISVQEVHRFLPNGYYLNFLDYSGSIGGYIATKSQIKPYLRNFILGMKILISDGSILEFPFKVVKNSAGYDIPKLFIGSWGWFGIILEVTLRLYPYRVEILKNNPNPFVPDKFLYKLKNVFDPENLFILCRNY